MSIFDKFKVNPYISTYAGAPVDAFNQVATNLQARYDKNLADMDQIELQMRNIQTMNADEGYKARLTKQYQDQIKQLSQAPESATRGVRALSKQFATDEKIQAMQQSKAQMDAATAEIKENDYSSFQLRKFNEALAEYNKVDDDPNSPTYGLKGAEAGRKFIAPNFYDEVDPGAVVDERVKGIKAVKNGTATVSADGTIKIKETGETISKERVRASAEGVLADSKMRRQIRDQFIDRFGREPGIGKDPKTGKKFNELTEYFVGEYVNPAISKYAVISNVQDLSGMRGGLRGGYAAQLKDKDAAWAAPAGHLMMGTELNEEYSTQERYDQRTELQNNLANGTYSNPADILAAENQLAVLNESLKQSFLTENSKFSPRIQEIIKNADPEVLWNIVNKKGDPTELDKTLAAFNTDEFDQEEYQRQVRTIRENHGSEVSTMFMSAVNPEFLRNAARNELRYERNPQTGIKYGWRIPRELELERMAKIRNDRISAMQEELRTNYTGITASNTFDISAAQKFFEDAGLSKEDAEIAQRQMGRFINDTGGLGFAKGYEDLMKDGLMSVATGNRFTVGATSVLSEADVAGLSNTIASQFNMQDFDQSLFEGFSVVQDGQEERLKDIDYDELEKYNMNELKVIRFDATNGSGYVRVSVPALEDGAPDMVMDLNLNQEMFKQARKRIANEAHRNALALEASNADPDQVELQRAVHANFAGTDILNDIKIGVERNAQNPATKHVIADDYIYFAFRSAVYPERTPDGDIIFRKADGSQITMGAENESLAYSQLMKAAERQYGQNNG